MALTHNFSDWHRCVSRMTKEAKKSTASHYVLYTGKGDDKPMYLLCSAEDEVKSLLVESLDTGRVIHRVGETSQLTGPRLFVWDYDLPPSMVWAVCEGSIDYDDEKDNVCCFYSSHKGIYLFGEKPRTHKSVMVSWFLSCDAEPPMMPLKEILSYPFAGKLWFETGEKTEQKREGIVGNIGRWGAIEHRWFGLVNPREMVRDFPDEDSIFPKPVFRLHDLLLGSRDEKA